MTDKTPTAREIAKGIRRSHGLNISLAAAASPKGDLGTACDMMEDAIEAAILAYAKQERRRCELAAISARFGAPSMWGGPNPRGWHLDTPCSPMDASMHDNGCVDALRAIRELPDEAAIERTRERETA